MCFLKEKKKAPCPSVSQHWPVKIATMHHDSHNPLIPSVSPIIVTFLSRVSTLIGDLVVLPCRAVGIEPITYTWTRGKEEDPISPTEDRHTDG